MVIYEKNIKSLEILLEKDLEIFLLEEAGVNKLILQRLSLLKFELEKTYTCNMESYRILIRSHYLNEEISHSFCLENLI